MQLAMGVPAARRHGAPRGLGLRALMRVETAESRVPALQLVTGPAT
jgi:hypothetical protein